MTNEQLYMAIGIPILTNAALVGILMAYINARFNAVDRRFDNLRDLWRSELHRVEGVIDARLRHIEESR